MVRHVITISWHCISEGKGYNSLPLIEIKHPYFSYIFFNLFYLLIPMVNHGIKDLKVMLEPCTHIVAFSRIAASTQYNGLQWYSFFKNMCFTIGKHVMTMFYYVFIALWFHSWPWVWNQKAWPWNNHG